MKEEWILIEKPMIVFSTCVLYTLEHLFDLFDSVDIPRVSTMVVLAASEWCIISAVTEIFNHFLSDLWKQRAD